MSWDATWPILLRNAIGDTATPPKYSDDTLAPLVLTAAQFLTFTLPLPTSYAVDVENVSISPDPTDPSTPDNGFVYLVTLKAAAMLLKSEVRIYGQQAIAIRDGTSAIDLKRDLKALTQLAESYEQELEQGIFLYLRNASGFSGRAIVSPYKTLLSNIDHYFVPRICRIY